MSTGLAQLWAEETRYGVPYAISRLEVRRSLSLLKPGDTLYDYKPISSIGPKFRDEENRMYYMRAIININTSALVTNKRNLNTFWV